MLVMVLEAVIGVPLVVAVAFAFSLVFERPFQSSSKAGRAGWFQRPLRWSGWASRGTGAVRRRSRARGWTASASLTTQAPAAPAPAAPADARLDVLFLTTATLPPLGADTWVSVQLMRELDRDAHTVHVACATGPAGDPTPTFLAVRGVRGLHVLPVDLGPELAGEPSLKGRLGALWATLPALGSLVRLARYIRRHDIRVIHSTDRPRERVRVHAPGEDDTSAQHRPRARRLRRVDVRTAPPLHPERRRADRHLAVREAHAGGQRPSRSHHPCGPERHRPRPLGARRRP